MLIEGEHDNFLMYKLHYIPSLYIPSIIWNGTFVLIISAVHVLSDITHIISCNLYQEHNGMIEGLETTLSPDIVMWSTH